ncbi:hypothetical protein [Pirellulimonas nuda]|uniref:hypothetical protein n=1 Tax=Pirellulimonas nuda TaxID=2528009 RepID=UPI0011A77067|nr:hypothetical protein [Pirellulimonas nuda]
MRGGEPIWLPAGLLAVLLTLTMALSAFGAEPASNASTLTWRPARNTPRAPRPFVATPAMTSIQSAPVNPLRATTHYDSSVRTVAYGDDPFGPTLGPAQPGSARLQSVIVHRPGAPVRLAQLDSNERYGADDLRDEVESPFGDGFDELPAPEPMPIDPSPLDDQPDGPSGLQPPREVPNRPGDLAPPRNPQPTPPSVLNPPRETSPSDGSRPNGAGQDAADAARQKGREKDLLDSQRSCVEELAALKANRIDSVSLAIGVSGEAGKDFPYNCSVDDGTPFAGRCWPSVTYMWKASALCHKPLFFEDVALERYGHSHGPFLQPLVSGAHFFGRLPALPYCMGLTPPNECMYTLGYYRPGSCAPYLVGGMPFTWRAAAFQAGAVVGVSAIIP